MVDVDDLRDAASLELARRQQRPEGDHGAPAAPETTGRLTRAVFDVTVDGRSELVTVAIKDGELLLSSTAAEGDERHILEVLRSLSAAAPSAFDGFAQPQGLRISAPADTESQRASVPPAARPGEDGGGFRAALADALEDVITAVVRVGVAEARVSPTVNEALERLVAAAPSPLPAAIGRWLGMLRGALAAGEVDTAARILDGAARIARDLRAEAPDGVARRRLVSWLGAGLVGRAEVSRVSDRTLAELSREYLPGARGAAIERRYLVCLQSGEVFREERVRGAARLSVGPCPRVVTVGLADVEEGAPPRRMRLLQYAVSNVLTAEHWARLREVARPSFAALVQDYREALTSYPGLAEPYALVAPRGTDRGGSLVLLDAEDDPLPVAVAEAPAREQALRAFIGDDEPDWVAGRLIDVDGTLLLIPCAVGLQVGSERRVFRLT